MALSALLVLLAFASPALLAVDLRVSCGTAVSGGDCRKIDLNQSQCYNDREYAYDAMKVSKLYKAPY